MACTLPASILAQQGWMSYGGNAQHTGVWTGTSQTAALIKWQIPLDDDRPYYGGDVLIHYAAPMVTPANTVVHSYRFTTNVNDSTSHDNWRVVGRSAKNGAQIWAFDTDYSAAVIWPYDWTSVYPMTLFKAPLVVSSHKGALAVTGATSVGVAAAANGGSLLIRNSADAATGTVQQIAFYTSAADYKQNASAYSPIKINTPLTADNYGNIYFGYEVTNNVPANVASLGTGGIAKVNAVTGACTFKSVQAMKIDANLYRPGMNCAPALSNDGNFIYVGLIGGGGSYLAKLDTNQLNTAASTLLMDPSVDGGASLINESSASPMVAPDGRVFMGVFGNSWRESHGWMLQFDANLNNADSRGRAYPVGAFGWDDTASVVPSSMVPNYTGSAKYLLCTKYNNYDMGGDPGADGSNKVAILDPTSNSSSKDRQSGIPVMNEILTVLGPTRTNDDPNHPDARNEWCINSVAVDVNRRSVIVNSEDGHMYRWSFVNNTLSEGLNLQPATGEAYTETAIGPDGSMYAINNSILCCIGTNLATSVSVYQGAGGSGGLSAIQYLDGTRYTATSSRVGAAQTVFVEADFSLNAVNPTTLNIVSSAIGATGVTGAIKVYNYQTFKFDTVATKTLGGSQQAFNATVTTNVSQYIGPNGKVRVLVGGVMSPNYSQQPFQVGLDLVTCGAY